MKSLMRTGNQEDRRDGLLQSAKNLPNLLFWLRQGFKQESGRSLPAALITLAVGSLLLTPFLSFVSSRSLGTRAAEGAFSEQYAADAGIEFGIWSLLNDSAFRNQVDINAGVAQPLAFPGPINGYTPSISVTGLPIGSWYLREFATAKIEKGGSLAYTGGDRVYALWGDGKKTFRYYSISADQWFSLTDIPTKVDIGGALVYAGGNFIYALPGNSKEFWRYNISNNTWAMMENTDDTVKDGGALAYAGGDYIYALRGDKKKDFWRYDITNDSWDDLANTLGNVKTGADLVAVGGYIFAFRGDKNPDFWRYNIALDSWSSRQDAPGNVDKGGSLAYYSGNYIYAFQGKSTGFWRYTVTMNSWTVLADTPSAVGRGGDLVFTHSQGGFAFRGGKNQDYWEFEVTPPRYDISSQAGSVDTDARIEIGGSTNTILF